MHVSMNNIFKIFSIDVLDNFFAQKFDQEEGRNEIKILVKKSCSKSLKCKKNQTSICLHFEKR